jgi:hypothetical protein
MCSYYYFVDEINEEIKNDRFFNVNLVYVYNIIINDSCEYNEILLYGEMGAIKGWNKSGEKAKKSVGKKVKNPTETGFKRFLRKYFPSHSYEINKLATIVTQKDGGRFRKAFPGYKRRDYWKLYIQSL